MAAFAGLPAAELCYEMVLGQNPTHPIAKP
jgi:hypothetical protein